MWYTARDTTRGPKLERELRKNKKGGVRNIPSLYFLACKAYHKHAGAHNNPHKLRLLDYLIEDSDPYPGGLEPLMPAKTLPLFILEARNTPDDRLYLSNPVRFNPWQWRLVYVNPDAAADNNIIVVMNKVVNIKLTTMQDLPAGRLQQILREFREAMPNNGQPEESVWLDHVDVMHLELPRYWTDFPPKEPDQDIIYRMKEEEARTTETRIH